MVSRIADSGNSLNCLLEDMRTRRLVVMVPYCYIIFLEKNPNASIYDEISISSSDNLVSTSAVPNFPVAVLIDDPKLLHLNTTGRRRYYMPICVLVTIV